MEHPLQNQPRHYIKHQIKHLKKELFVDISSMISLLSAAAAFDAGIAFAKKQFVATCDINEVGHVDEYLLNVHH